MVSQTRIWFSDPLPPPGALEWYNNVEPGLANRVVKMAENQSVHKISFENRAINSSITKEYPCWFSATLLGPMVTGLGAFLVYKERNEEGYASISATTL